MKYRTNGSSDIPSGHKNMLFHSKDQGILKDMIYTSDNKHNVGT